MSIRFPKTDEFEIDFKIEIINYVKGNDQFEN